MKIVCIIPARLKSERFPKKVLSYLGSKPLLQWIWEAAKSCLQFSDVAFAIDHAEIGKLIHSFQGNYLMTAESCQSGTDRLVEIMNSGQIRGDIWVNWQGDEPLINRSMIDTLLQSIDIETSDIWTLRKKIDQIDEIDNPHVVKVVTDKNEKALYFSRASIPYARHEIPIYYKHIGLYAFTQQALEKIQKMPMKTSLEKWEGLEQLRFIEEGLSIKAHETIHETQGIDTREDLIRLSRLLSVHDKK